ncbi:MAG: ABC transporter permease subunit, partial [Chloroflexi bacterium]|nr:ABC transporter permease subunit [Chloroflexota bacterium]
SLLFTLVYGSIAVSRPLAERVLIPILDILQSIPILSFMPGVVLALVAVFPRSDLGVELASVVLIFTSQAWNMTFSFYHSLRTVPKDLVDASRLYRLTWWQRFWKRDVAFSVIGLVWNSMMSWAGGWFFLMAAETFTLGDKDFRLPGLGSYLQAAANAGDSGAIAWGIAALVLLIVLIDQLLWRPLIAWADKFKVELVESDVPPESWFLDALRGSAVLRAVGAGLARLRDDVAERRAKTPSAPPAKRPASAASRRLQRAGGWLLGILALVLVGLGISQAAGLLAGLDLSTWGGIALDFVLTLARVAAALVIGTLWTVPAGVAIGLNPRLARVLQPVVQVVASIPATAVFPIIVAALLQVSGGLNVASIVLMLLGTQWYVLFNVIAGATSIPTDLQQAARVLKLRGWLWWRRMVLPAIFPFLVTGLLTATGGAWNASIVSEYVTYRGQQFSVRGLGAAITDAAANGRYDLLLGSTLVMALGVALVNRLLWKRLYRLAEERFRLE